MEGLLIQNILDLILVLILKLFFYDTNTIFFISLILFWSMSLEPKTRLS